MDENSIRKRYTRPSLLIHPSPPSPSPSSLYIHLAPIDSLHLHPHLNNFNPTIHHTPTSIPSSPNRLSPSLPTFLSFFLSSFQSDYNQPTNQLIHITRKTGKHPSGDASMYRVAAHRDTLSSVQRICIPTTTDIIVTVIVVVETSSQPYIRT